MLIVFGGLPGSGKSTIAQALARRMRAVYLRVDSIEQAIRSSASQSAGDDVGPAGYLALYRVAADNLDLGHAVVADAVNPIAITRSAFRQVAAQAGVRFIEVEIVCSDRAIHRRRAETRSSTVDGLVPPTWAQIQALNFEPWSPDLRIDASILSVDDSVAAIMTLL